MAVNLDEDESGSGFFNGSVPTNASLSLCAAISLSVPLAQTISKDFFIVLRIGLFLYNFIIMVFGLALNILIIWVPFKNKKLRTIDTAIAVHIALLNLLRTMLESSTSVVNAAAGVWIFGATSCAIQGFFVTFVTLTRRLMMLALAIDRFLLVHCTFTYPMFRARVVIACSVATWTIPAILLIPSLPGLEDCFSVLPPHTSCFFAGSCSHTCSNIALVIFIATLLPSYIIPMILFSSLYCKSRRFIATSTQQAEEVKESSKKANITFFLLFLSYFVITVPTTVGYIITAAVTRFHGYDAKAEIVLAVASYSTLSLVVVDAIVILRNRDIKEALKNIWNMNIRLLY